VHRGQEIPLDGRHELRLAFVNDLCEEGEDRNLNLDKVVCYKE
jgi:hypothetical protein